MPEIPVEAEAQLAKLSKQRQLELAREESYRVTEDISLDSGSVEPVDSSLEDLELLSEVAASAEEIASVAKDSPDFLNALALPDIAEYNYPPFYVAAWKILTGYASSAERLMKYFALGLPRGFAKTSFIKLLVLWIILFSKKRFILILSENREKAQNIISDIIDMLDETNIKATFGDWRLACETDTLSLKKFSFRGRDIIIAGLGQGGSVRGLNIKNARPDVILMDDVQSREAADSDVLSEGIYRWMLGTVMKAKSHKGVLALFIANMYPTPNSILRKLDTNPFWEKLIAGGIIHGPDGKMESLWEELRPLQSLLEEYQMDEAAGQAEVFFAEVLNDPHASANNSLDISKVTDPNVQDDDIHQGSFVFIDPASGKVTGDDVAIGYFQVYDGKPILWDLAADKFSPGQTIWTAIKFCMSTGCRLIVVEGNAYQSTLVYWFNTILAQAGIEGINVVPINSGRGSKNSRILTMFKSLMSGEIGLHPRVRTRVLTQARAFNPLKTNNRDDILDLVAYASRVLAEFAEFMVNQTVIEQQMHEVIEDDYGTDMHTIDLSPV